MTIFLIALLSTNFLAAQAEAQAPSPAVPQGFVVEGRLYDDLNNPLNSSSVNLKLEIIDDASCVLFREIHSAIDVSADSGPGIFAVTLGASPDQEKAVNVTLADIFSNSDVAGLDACAANGLERSLRISVDKDGSGTYVTLTPNTRLVSVPTAMFAGLAKDAETLEGKSSANFVQTNADALTQANVENIFSAGNYTKLTSLLNGTSTQYLPYSPATPVSFNGQRLTNLAAPSDATDAANKSYVDSYIGGRAISSAPPTNGQVLKWNGSAWAPATDDGITALTGDVLASGSGSVAATIAPNAITSAKINSTGIAINRILITDGTTGANVSYATCASVNQIMAWTANGWQCTTVASLAPVTSVAGKTGAVTLNAADIDGLGTAAVKNVGTNAGDVVELQTGGRLPAVDGSSLTNVTARRLTNGSGVYWSTPTAEGTNGYVLSTDGNGQLTWVSNTSGSVTSVTATSPLSSSGGFTPNISISQANGSTNGYLSSTDWTTFNNKSPAAGSTSLNTVGTITTGTWNGSMIQPAYGGTGLNASAAANGQLLIGNGSGFTLATITGTANRVSVTNSAGGITLSGPQDLHSGASPTFTGLTLSGMTSAGLVKNSASGVLSGGNLLNMATDITGILPVANGGTGTSTGSITGTGALTFAAGGTNQNVTLTPSGSGSTVLNGNVSIGASTPAARLELKGDLRMLGSNSGSVTFKTAVDAGSASYTLPAADGTSGFVLSTNGSGALSWVSNSTGSVTSVSATAPLYSSGSTTPTLTISQASGSSDGYISSTDWTTFNGKAPLASPAFTGTPTAPTAAADTNTTQIATTAYVLGQASTTNPLMDGTAAAGTSTKWSRGDHVHPIDTSRAPAAGSSSITTLGTITTGTWNGTIIGVPYGGTGTSTGSITGTGALTFAAGGTNQNVTLTPSGTGATLLNGNVGIGTTTPGSKLDVKGAIRLSGSNSGYVGFQPAADAGSTTYTLPAADGSSGYILKTNGSGVLSWVDPSTAMTVSTSPTFSGLTLSNLNTAGFVKNSASGVISTSPSVSLTTDVSGILPVANGGTGLNGSSASNGQLLIGNGTGFTLANLTGTANRVTVTNSAGGITLSGPQDIHTTASPQFSSITLSNTTDSVLGIGALEVQAGGSNQNVTLSPSGTGNTILNGKVGIGTATPSERVHAQMNSTSNAVVMVENTNSGGDALFRAQNSNSNTIEMGIESSDIFMESAYLTTNTFGGVKIESTASPFLYDPSIAFYVNASGLGSSEQMRIHENGNVGIGTASPAEKLSVNGIIQSTNTTSGGFKFPNGTIQTTARGPMRMQIITNSSATVLVGTWNVPSDATSIKVTVIGGGGSGGCPGTSGNTVGGGGAAAGVIIGTFNNLNPSSTNTISYEIGNSGAACTVNDSAGNTGGTSKLNLGAISLTANGGSGGSRGTGFTTGSTGGSTSITGSSSSFMRFDGQNGAGGFLNNSGNSIGLSGTGGTPAGGFGVGGAPIVGDGQNLSAVNGSAGSGYGAGGSGGVKGGFGGAGAPGVIIIEY